MILYYFLFAVLIFYAFGGRRVEVAQSCVKPAKWIAVAASCAVLVAAYVAQTFVIDYAARSQVPLPTWLATLPLPVIDDRAPIGPHTSSTVGLAILVATLAQTGALGVLAALLQAPLDRRATLVATVSAGALIVTALESRAVTSFDMYAYIGSALEGARAWDPPAMPLPPPYEVIDRIYGVPIFPSAYGPAWLVLSHVLALPGTLAGSLWSARLLGLVSYLLCLRALIFARVEPRVVWLFALSPGIIELFVAEGHNDGFPLACCLFAYGLLQRPSGGRSHRSLAIALVVLAGSFKLSFIAIGLLAFVPERRPLIRVFYATASVALAGAIASIAGGRAYLGAIEKTMQLYHMRGGYTEHAILQIAAVLLVAIAVAMRRFYAGAGLATVGLGATLFPWYLTWTLPYALLAGDAWLLLVAMPLLGFAFSTTFSPTIELFIVLDAIALGLVATGAIRRLRAAQLVAVAFRSAGTRRSKPLSYHSQRSETLK